MSLPTAAGVAADPIVVLGMHRSGTSLVGRLLRNAGVFMGNDLDSHGESRGFRDLNHFLLRVGHADWDYPLPMRYVLEVPALCDELVRYLVAEIEGDALRDAYFGEGTGRKQQVAAGWPLHWGWKDPRNTLTLPLWRRVFPGLRAIHVVRNGIDVANSLVERERSRVPRLGQPARSVRCLAQDRAFTLWTEYLTAGLEVLAGHSKDRALTIFYEELLASPHDQIVRLLDFAGHSASQMEVEALVDSVDVTRAFAYREESPAVPCDQIGHELMCRMGYGPPHA